MSKRVADILNWLVIAKPPHPNRGSAIKHALYYFMGYSPQGPEVQAIYALRNGMVHEGSLTFKTKSQAHYIFRYDFSLTSAIQLAATPWDGQAATLGTSTTTLVNPRVLTDDISGAIDAVRDCFFQRRADLKNPENTGGDPPRLPDLAAP